MEEETWQIISRWTRENREKKRKRKRIIQRRIIKLFFLSLFLFLGIICLKPKVWAPPCLDFQESQELEIKIQTTQKTQKLEIETRPKPKVEKVRSPSKSSSSQPYFYLVKKHFPAYAWKKALLTVKKESSGNCRAENINRDGSRDRGLFQINEKTWSSQTTLPFSRAFEPETNVRVASRIFASRGWKAWRAWRR